jgi:hypothetical protein
LRLGRLYRRWLLIFASAEEPAMVRPFFPVDGPGQILPTSRNRSWAGIARPLEVTVFQREESRPLLALRRSGLVDADADLIAEKLGDLPLAIEQAGSWLTETGMPARDYLDLFDEKVTEILDTATPKRDESSVAAAWNVSSDELNSRGPAAHQLLQFCAFFAPEPISRSLFTGVRDASFAPCKQPRPGKNSPGPAPERRSSSRSASSSDWVSSARLSCRDGCRACSWSTSWTSRSQTCRTICWACSRTASS